MSEIITLKDMVTRLLSTLWKVWCLVFPHVSTNRICWSSRKPVSGGSAAKCAESCFSVLVLAVNEPANTVQQSQVDCVKGSVLSAGWHASFQPHPCAVRDLCASQLGSIHSEFLGPFAPGMDHCTHSESFLRIWLPGSLVPPLTTRKQNWEYPPQPNRPHQLRSIQHVCKFKERWHSSPHQKQAPLRSMESTWHPVVESWSTGGIYTLRAWNQHILSLFRRWDNSVRIFSGGKSFFAATLW